MDNLIKNLSACPIFADIPQKIIREAVIPNGQLQILDKGQHIFQFQDVISKFSIVLEGRVNTMFIFESGHYSILDTAQISEIIAVDLIYTSGIAPYYAVAATPSKIFSISNELLTNENSPLKSYLPAVHKKLLTLISNDNVRKAYRLAILSQKGLRDRIMTYFTMQVKKRGSSTIYVPFSREELASFLCVNRSALSHELSLMEDEGLIKFYKNTFTILTE